MKKYLFIFTILFAATQIYSQTQKKDQLISGLGYGNGSHSRFGTNINISLTASYQYFLFKNFSVGAGVNSFSSWYSDREMLNRSCSIRLFPETRYYFFNGRWKPYVFLNGGTGWTRWNSGTVYTRRLPWSTEEGIGLNYFASPKVGIEARVGYLTNFPQNGNYHYASGQLNFKMGIVYSIRYTSKKVMTN
ncbi:MAG: hypothetical protein HY064_13960 [Bacteroidetes bacterium]|nr:hypothetical protein [Bacteroidota bacterium]